jgi:molecular chaperone DnaK (HSP70)
MSEMIERVARALAENERGADLWDEISNDSDIDYIGKNEFRDLARAAIEAMREPTEGMVEAANLHESNGVYADWQAMIDEALR